MIDVSNAEAEEYGSVGPRRLIVRWEIATVFGAYFVPSVLSGLLYPYWRRGTGVRENLDDIAWSIGGILLIGFVLWVSGDELQRFGIQRAKKADFWRVPLLFIGIAWPAIIYFVRQPYPEYEAIREAMRPDNALTWSLLVVATLANVLFQELFARGYMLIRFEEVFSSRTSATLISSALFGIWHFYGGVNYVMITFVIGLIFSWAFWKWRSLWPLVAAHFAYNLLASAWP